MVIGDCLSLVVVAFFFLAALVLISVKNVMGKNRQPARAQPIQITPPPIEPVDARVIVPAPNAGPAAGLGTGRGCFCHVVGESFYQEALSDLRREQKRLQRELAPEYGVRDGWRDFEAILVLEPDNPHDPNAVSVRDVTSGSTLGYLTAAAATKYQPLLAEIAAQGHPLSVSATLTGGTREKRMIGVYIDLEGPRLLAKRFGLKLRRTPPITEEVSPDVQEEEIDLG